MALVKCPECSKEVSNFADKCPHCGLKLNTLTAGMLKLKQKAEEIKAEKERDPEVFKARLEEAQRRNNPNLTAGQAVKIVAGLLIFCFVTVGLWVEFVDKPREAKRAAEEAYRNSPEGKKEARKAQIQQGFGLYGEHKALTKLIKSEMDDPSSFELASCVWVDMDDHVVVIEEFRGRNAYGVMQLFSVKAKCDFDGGVTEVMNVKRMR